LLKQPILSSLTIKITEDLNHKNKHMILELNNKPAVKINAILLHHTSKSYKLDCEGDIRWLPKSKCKPIPLEKTALIDEWWYNNKFEDE